MPNSVMKTDLAGYHLQSSDTTPFDWFIVEPDPVKTFTSNKKNFMLIKGFSSYNDTNLKRSQRICWAKKQILR